MLTDLHIVNFALVENQTITLHAGLNVLSGETGAGKSIVLQAIQFLMGAKPKSSPIRTGADSCEVHGSFDLSLVSPQILSELPDIARAEHDGELLISRSVNRQGKGKVFINGRLAPLGVLNEIMQRLIHVCGQNQQVRLLEPRYHLELLDHYAGVGEKLELYQREFNAWRMDAERLAALKADETRQHERRQQLEEIVTELEPLELYPGIRADLEAKLKKASSAERLLELGSTLESELDGEGGLLPHLKRVSALTNDLSRLDSATESLVALFTSARTELSEFQIELRRYLAGVEVDEESLGRMRDELAEIARFERKYRSTDEGLIELLKKSSEELQAVDSAKDIAALERRVEQGKGALLEQALALRKARRAAATELTSLVGAELAELNMPGARIEVAFDEVELGVMGCDRVEVLISANRGEPPRALKLVASGGELSRIMLVLKKVLRDQSGVNVLLFDEVDSGISGGVARAVGEKLRNLAQYSQVLCITHLPQVASLADHHFLVDKQNLEDSTRSVIRELNKDQRVEEIARMLAGYHITPAARESARELLSIKNTK